MISKDTYKKAGYAYYVSWNEQHQSLGTVQKGFPTTYDAIDTHLESLHNDDKCFNITYERL